MKNKCYTFSLTDELDAEQTEGEEAGFLLGRVDRRRDDGGRPLSQRVLLVLGDVLQDVFLECEVTVQ